MNSFDSAQSTLLAASFLLVACAPQLVAADDDEGLGALVESDSRIFGGILGGAFLVSGLIAFRVYKRTQEVRNQVERNRRKAQNEAEQSQGTAIMIEASEEDREQPKETAIMVEPSEDDRNDLINSSFRMSPGRLSGPHRSNVEVRSSSPHPVTQERENKQTAGATRFPIGSKRRYRKQSDASKRTATTPISAQQRQQQFSDSDHSTQPVEAAMATAPPIDVEKQ